MLNEHGFYTMLYDFEIMDNIELNIDGKKAEYIREERLIKYNSTNGPLVWNTIPKSWGFEKIINHMRKMIEEYK